MNNSETESFIELRTVHTLVEARTNHWSPNWQIKAQDELVILSQKEGVPKVIKNTFTSFLGGNLNLAKSLIYTRNVPT